MSSTIDFAITVEDSGLLETQSLFWAEAKRGKSDVFVSLVLLILTTGKARTFDRVLPPAFLGAFDSEQMEVIFSIIILLELPTPLNALIVGLSLNKITF